MDNEIEEYSEEVPLDESENEIDQERQAECDKFILDCNLLDSIASFNDVILEHFGTRIAPNKLLDFVEYLNTAIYD